MRLTLPTQTKMVYSYMFGIVCVIYIAHFVFIITSRAHSLRPKESIVPSLLTSAKLSLYAFWLLGGLHIVRGFNILMSQSDPLEMVVQSPMLCQKPVTTCLICFHIDQLSIPCCCSGHAYRLSRCHRRCIQPEECCNRYRSCP